jgi:alkanesulfonate monooxygenase SsuD/methylene tetrahydromethanopterin reductase-like flavin-dependent oxidoreductase (luciferase family)
VRLPSADETAGEGKAILGSHEEIARQLQSFAEVGVSHLIVALEPAGIESIEQFGRIAKLLRQQ